MLAMLKNWYERRFSEFTGCGVTRYFTIWIYNYLFFSDLLAPLLIAIVLAYLLEWPVSY